MQVAYIHWAGLGERVWGRPSAKALERWPRFAALAYPAALMRCMESFCYSGMTVVAGTSRLVARFGRSGPGQAPGRYSSVSSLVTAPCILYTEVLCAHGLRGLASRGHYGPDAGIALGSLMTTIARSMPHRRHVASTSSHPDSLHLSQ